jgi:LPS export ABC transporter protein LptC
MSSGRVGLIVFGPDIERAAHNGHVARQASIYRMVTRAVRVVLGVLALVTIFFVFLWPSLKQQNLSKDVRAVGIPATNQVIAPRFDAVDDRGQPYKITADRATQDQTNPDLIHLDRPHGELTQRNGTVLKLRSERGAYDQAKKILDLMGNVTLTTSDGYTATTDVAHIEPGPQIVTTPGVVKATGPDGMLEGVRLSADGVDGSIIIHGPATLILNKGVW